MTGIHYCKNCKYLDHDGMFGIFCAVGGNNKNYDCPKYEKKGVKRITEKRFEFEWDMNIIDNITGKEYDLHCDEAFEFIKIINDIVEENEQLRKDREDLFCCERGAKNDWRKLKYENEQLKILLQNISDQRDEFHRGARENANHVGKLEKENEQLKKAYNDAKSDVEKYEQILKDIMIDNLLIQDVKKELKGITEERFIIDDYIDVEDKVQTYELHVIRDTSDGTFYIIADSFENVNYLIDKLNKLEGDKNDLY